MGGPALARAGPLRAMLRGGLGGEGHSASWPQPAHWFFSSPLGLASVLRTRVHRGVWGFMRGTRVGKSSGQGHGGRRECERKALQTPLWGRPTASPGLCCPHGCGSLPFSLWWRVALGLMVGIRQTLRLMEHGEPPSEFSNLRGIGGLPNVSNLTLAPRESPDLEITCRRKAY